MSWKEALKNNINSVEKLKKYINISPEDMELYRNIGKVFPISSTTYYLDLIDPEDPEDPIRKMAIPSISEFDMDGDFDTSGEQHNTKMQGLQHKYDATALILSTNKCAMYCRHCFRKRLVGTQTTETVSFINDVVDYIKSHPEINNVLISGGDSFLIDTSLIKEYLEQLSQIEHLDFIRFGTRTPVVFPERIYNDSDLLDALKEATDKKQIYVVTQFNHPKELTQEAMQAVRALKETGVVVNNQTVLLKGVNDEPAVLAELQNDLVRKGIVPYYIFQCRPVKGVVNQFQLSLKEGAHIVNEARKLMNGHSKRSRYCMSHETGKIEILGMLGDEMLFKYHQSKDASKSGEIFTKRLEPNQAWL